MNKKITWEIVLYVIFGVLTTLINVLAYSLFYYLLKLPNTASTVVAWVLSVAFAYITNRIWVFESENENTIRETLNFFLCRTATGILDLVIMYMGVDILLFEGTVIKIFSNIIVIILNYLASKLFIFKKQ